MDDSGTKDSGTNNASTDAETARQSAQGGHHGLARYARPALVAGCIIAVVCVALLVIIFFLDSFNATVYSVGGKDVQDATDEARSIRDNYAAARVGGIIVLVIGLALAAAGGFGLYRRRKEQGWNDGDDDGEDVDFEDLGGK
ncbi:LPXTG cell wall anchor domain-containing protein [Arthrobacter sp. UYCu712]|uniref:LPXTG cell wall anchor domain-containing protein n=1 Tax=Arthrobacter sp. UYCu712 TaxID=3156340 RepID=UPI0033950A94